MRALGWGVTILVAAAVSAALVSAITGWDSIRVYSFMLGMAVFLLAEKVWGE